MKIDNRVVEAYQRAGVAAVGPKPQAPAAAPVAGQAQGTPSEAAKVTISAEARALAQSADAPIDQKKVDKLQAQVKSGEYKVDSQVVARRMLDKLA